MAMARFGFASHLALIMCFEQEVGAELQVSIQDSFTLPNKFPHIGCQDHCGIVEE